MNNLIIIDKLKGVETNPVNDTFLDHYRKLCRQEGNQFSDSEVAQLPELSSTHKRYQEWKFRVNSCKKLLRAIKSKGNRINILDIGCGNGWLTAKLSGLTSGKVMGIDISASHITQAKKIFTSFQNLQFIEADIRKGIPDEIKFDIIVIASSIEYFSSLTDLISLSLKHLGLLGEIHIVDSRFYRAAEMVAVREKFKNYFTRIGIPGMTRFYFPHLLEEMEPFQYKVMFDPQNWINKLFPDYSPFHHVIVKNRYP